MLSVLLYLSYQLCFSGLQTGPGYVLFINSGIVIIIDTWVPFKLVSSVIKCTLDKLWNLFSILDGYRKREPGLNVDERDELTISTRTNVRTRAINSRGVFNLVIIHVGSGSWV